MVGPRPADRLVNDVLDWALWPMRWADLYLKADELLFSVELGNASSYRPRVLDGQALIMSATNIT